MKRGGYIKRKVPLKTTHAIFRKKKPPTASKLPQPKLWKLKRADDEISLWVRERDGRCMFPNCDVRDIKSLQCSHYIGRAHKATRFDPDNLIALCWHHHYKSKEWGYEYQKQTIERNGWDGQYTLFMKRWLGEERFSQLINRGKQTMPVSSAIMNLMKFLGKL